MKRTVKVRATRYEATVPEVERNYPRVLIQEIGGGIHGKGQSYVFETLAEALLALASGAIDTLWIVDVALRQIGDVEGQLPSELVLHRDSTGIKVSLYTPGLLGEDSTIKLAADHAWRMPPDLTGDDHEGDTLRLELNLGVSQEASAR